MEVDDWADFNKTVEDDPIFPKRPELGFLIWQLLKVFVAVSSIVSNILIVYGIVKLKKFQEIRYFCLCNWSVMNAFTCLITPFVSLIYHALIHRDHVQFTGFLCFVIKTQAGLVFLTFFTAILLTVDWIINNIFQSWYDGYKSKIIIYEIIYYIVTVLFLWYGAQFCFTEWDEINFSSISDILIFFVFHLIVLYLVYFVFNKRGNQQLKIDFTLILPTVQVLCWLPYLFVHYVIDRKHRTLFMIAHFTAQCIILSNAFINVYILGRLDAKLKEKCLEFVKCDCNNTELDSTSEEHKT